MPIFAASLATSFARPVGAGIDRRSKPRNRHTRWAVRRDTKTIPSSQIPPITKAARACSQFTVVPPIPAKVNALLPTWAGAGALAVRGCLAAGCNCVAVGDSPDGLSSLAADSLLCPPDARSAMVTISGSSWETGCSIPIGSSNSTAALDGMFAADCSSRRAFGRMGTGRLNNGGVINFTNTISHRQCMIAGARHRRLTTNTAPAKSPASNVLLRATSMSQCMIAPFTVA